MSATADDTVAEVVVPAQTGPNQYRAVIDGLRWGYETLLNRTFQQGVDLSGGEWQRVAAGRELYRDAPLLIMDEPSSALDPLAEYTLFQAVRDRQGMTTTIVITHRLANTIHADLIVVLDHAVLRRSATTTN